MEQTSIIDLIFSNFSLSIIENGWQLNVSWTMTFFVFAAILTFNTIRRKLRKKEK